MDDALGRYVKSTHLAAEKCRDFSIAGPDGTKVGTDLSIFVGHLMCVTENPKVAVMPPQVMGNWKFVWFVLEFMFLHRSVFGFLSVHVHP